MISNAKTFAFRAANSTFQYAKENPGAAAAMGVAGVMIAAPAVVAAPALAAVGFGANGIAAGSTAAGVHAGIGNLVAHGGFATLQSAGMAGYGAPIVHGIVQAAGAAVGAGTAYSKAKEGTKYDQRKPSEGGNNLKGSKRDSKL